MNDNMLMTKNKLLWHMDRVMDWKRGEKIAPLHVDMGLSQGCNIRCHYCFGMTQGNKFENGLDSYVKEDDLLNFIKDCAQVDVRSIAFIGEGEPLINPAAYRAINLAKQVGIDCALATNLILWKDTKESRQALNSLTWIRINISAGNQEGYEKIHNSKQFNTVVEKIKLLVNLKKEMHLKLTIGIQMILTDKSLDQVEELAMLGKKLKVDYFVIKQCSDSLDGEIGYYDKMKDYLKDEFQHTLRKVELLSTEDYQVIVRWSKMIDHIRTYDRCLGAPFILFTTGDGRIYSCPSFFAGEGHKKYLLGDYSKDNFINILKSEHYWEVMQKVLQIDVKRDCYPSCRTHSINKFLWNYNHPPKHLNFV